MLQELITVRMGEKLTAVPLITSIRASPTSSAPKFGGDTLSIATLKLCGATLTCIDVNKNRKQYVILNDLVASTAVCLLYTSKDLYLRISHQHFRYNHNSQKK